MSLDRVGELLKELQLYVPSPITFPGDRMMAMPMTLDIARQVPEPLGIPSNPRLDYTDAAPAHVLLRNLKAYTAPGEVTVPGVHTSNTIGEGVAVNVGWLKLEELMHELKGLVT